MTIQLTGPSDPRREGTSPTRSINGVARVSDETQIRQRILDGTYNSAVVRDAVASALRTSGDLR